MTSASVEEIAAVLLYHAQDDRVIDPSNDTVIVNRELLRQSAAALSRLPTAPGGWRDIATAPKNGTSVTLWRVTPDVSFPQQAHWLEIGGKSGWWGGMWITDATHWVKLAAPAAPQPDPAPAEQPGATQTEKGGDATSSASMITSNHQNASKAYDAAPGEQPGATQQFDSMSPVAANVNALPPLTGSEPFSGEEAEDEVCKACGLSPVYMTHLRPESRWSVDENGELEHTVKNVVTGRTIIGTGKRPAPHASEAAVERGAALEALARDVIAASKGDPHVYLEDADETLDLLAERAIRALAGDAPSAAGETQ